MTFRLLMRRIRYNSKLEFHRLISKIAAMYAYARENDYEQAINDSLRLVGEFVKADRVYTFKYDFENNTCSNTFEYCAKGISHEIENLQGILLEEIPDWVSAHLKGEVLYIPDVNKLLKTNRVREILEPQRVKSLITIPLVKDDEVVGFLGFDSVLHKRKYTWFEQMLLSEFSVLLVNLIKRIEMALTLEMQKQKINYILDAANLGVWEWDLESNVVKYNKRWANMVGYELEELHPHTLDTWKELTDPDDLEIAMEKLQQTVEGKNQRYESEFRMRHKDGHTVWIRDIGKVIEAANGRAKIMIGAHLDVSEMKKQHQYLHVKMKALDFSPAAVIISDENGDIQYVNPKFSEMTGYAVDEALHRNPRMLKSGEHDSQFYESMWSVLRSGRSWKGEFRNKRKNGDLYWETALISPVLDEQGVIMNYVAVKSDITGKKEQEFLYQSYKEELEKKVQGMMEEVEESQKAAIIALAKITESRDYDTGKHVERVQHLSKVLASALGSTDKYRNIIDYVYLDDLFFASALHDIGKIKVPDAVLLKPGQLNLEEFESIKRHTQIGYDILSEMARRSPKRIFIMAARVAKSHHERWDGSGYPEKLEGAEIPLEARIMSLVDVYDAMRSKRPYKDEYSHACAVAFILKGLASNLTPR